MSDAVPYRHRVQIGDCVLMPDGRLGTVVGIDFPLAPCFKGVYVRPDKVESGWRRYLPNFRRYYVEEAIDQLKFAVRCSWGGAWILR